MNLSNKYKHQSHKSIIIGLLSIVLFTIAIILYYNRQKQNIIERASKELEVVSNLKMDLLQRWYKEQTSGLEILTNYSSFGNIIEKGIVQTDSVINALRGNLASIVRRSGYENIAIVDSNANLIFSLIKDGCRIEESTKKIVQQMVAQNRVVINDAFFCKNRNEAIFEFIAPIYNKSGKYAAALIARVDPSLELYPMLSKWPTESYSSEVLLSQRKGDSLRIIGGLIRKSSDRTDITVPFVLLRQNIVNSTTNGAYITKDRLGEEEVLSLPRPIEGSGWNLIVKTGLEEVLSPLKKTRTTIIISIILYIALLSIYLQWKIKKESTKGEESSHFTSQEKYLAIFKDHIAPKLIIDPKSGRILEGNRAATLFYGYTSEEFQKMHLSNLLANSADKESIIASMLQKDGFVMNQTHIDANKKSHIAEIYGSRIPIDGVDYLHLVLFDITEKNHQEESQKMLYRITRSSMASISMPNLISVIRQELSSLLETEHFTVALMSNAGSQSQAGEQSQTDEQLEVLYSHGVEIDPKELNSREGLPYFVFSNGRPTLLHKSEMQAFLTLNSLKFSGQQPLSWLGVPLISQGKSIGVVVLQSFHNPKAYSRQNEMLIEMMVHELAIAIERARIIEDLTTAKERAEESDKLKSAFIGNISHEIKTPMNAILGFIELLADSDTDPQERESYIQIIKEAGSRLIKTISGLVEISKIEAGFIENNIHVCSINQLLEQITTLYSKEAKEKGLSFVVKNRLPKQLEIETDSSKIEGILQNLISNSIKFTKEGGVEIEAIKTEQSIILKVSDSGPGIPQEKEQQLFKAFASLDYRLNREHQGVGLGLAIVKSYIDALGGSVSFSSRPEGGTIFTVILPIKKA